MTPELWQRLKPLYQAAVEKLDEERTHFIVEACGNDEELKRELLALVEANNKQTCDIDFPLINPEGLIAKAARPFSVGQVVLGRFKIVRLIGRGGMGDVYEASDVELGRIALKTIRPDFAGSREIFARFKKEVQLARRVSGPHVCRVHELFVVHGIKKELPALFLTMEFLDGLTLADKIRDSGPFPWREAQVIGIEICAGLQTIHQAGIVHRDLKSRNIMLASRNDSACAVLMDFGLARELPSPTSETMNDFTRPGSIVGTPAYMAPEQFEGTEVSPATDVYALGIVLYELLTGRHPFAASAPIGAGVLRSRRLKPASSIQRGVPHHFDEVINKCLEYEAKRRYQSADEVALALKAHPFSARRVIERQPAVLRKRSTLTAVFVIFFLIATGMVLWFQSHRYHPPSSEVQRWYEMGAAALREGTYVKATRTLQVAVDHDKNFALGHARLADAWSELDFAGRAQQQMLLASAPELDRNLPALDRMYIEAVRSTLTHDFNGAVRQYKSILDALPEQEKAYGYVDLGRAWEKAGDLIAALKDYETAARLDKDNPAAFVHLGVLRSRQQDASGGEAAFRHAETIYQETSNQEGLAEIAYQRGYAENVRGESEQARANLTTSLTIARQISSVQLEVRALTQMSNVEYFAQHSDQAIQYANHAIEIARENELGYWSGDGLMRLGNAYLSAHELDKAESPLQAALRIAQQERQPRLEANAKFSLASVLSQRGKWDESIQFAQPALDYYKSVGMVVQATNASILIVRAQQNKNDLTAALQSANELLKVSGQSANLALVESSEELMGNVLSALERYPEALSHFEEALLRAHTIHENEPYQAMHCADVLWQLGRYTEAVKMLTIAESAKNPDLDSEAELVKTSILLSQGKLAQVISLVNQAFRPGTSKASPDDLPQFRLLRARAEVHRGETRQAAADLSVLSKWAAKGVDEDASHNVEILQAENYRRSGSPLLAEPLVESARLYFSASNKKESEWLCLLEQARVYQSLHKPQESRASAQLALDILKEFEHTWPPTDYKSYSARPDNMAAQRELATDART
jgi:serine/threonine protein kinase